MSLSSRELLKRRSSRTRYKLQAAANNKPILSVFRSNKFVYAQIIRDGNAITGVSGRVIYMKDGHMTKTQMAVRVGESIAVKAKELGISNVVFDRGGYRYHGNIKALADAARNAGLQF